MQQIERILTLTNYGSDEDGLLVLEKTRTTISPGMVLGVVASYEPKHSISGIDLYHVNVIFGDSTNVELFISLLDLDMLQRSVGMWFSPD